MGIMSEHSMFGDCNCAVQKKNVKRNISSQEGEKWPSRADFQKQPADLVLQIIIGSYFNS